MAKNIVKAFLDKNTVNFWKYVRRQTACKQSTPSCIDDVYGDDIAEVLSNIYDTLYNSAESCKEERNGINDRLTHLI